MASLIVLLAIIYVFNVRNDAERRRERERKTDIEGNLIIGKWSVIMSRMHGLNHTLIHVLSCLLKTFCVTKVLFWVSSHHISMFYLPLHCLIILPFVILRSTHVHTPQNIPHT